jgi:methylmalonyl-CoA/ethylmalonyl-CoA epimerase
MENTVQSRDAKERLRLPGVCQIGVVVKDLDSAVAYYSNTFGIGPFEFIERHYDGVTIRRRNDASYTVRLAKAPMGAVELELIQVTEGDSIHLEFLEKRGEGIEHLGFRVPDLDAEIKRFKESGIDVLQSVRRPDGGGYAYMDTENIGGIIFELIQQTN